MTRRQKGLTDEARDRKEAEMAKRAVVQALPGMEHRTIPALERAGVAYAEIRDERMALTARETALKRDVRTLMQQHQRTTYVSATVEITLDPPSGEDKVKVKVLKKKDDEE